MAVKSEGDTQPGIGVDAGGRGVIDPSTNVKALNEAATRRQDDLREASEKLVQARIDGLEKLSELRDSCAKEMRDAEGKRVDGEAKLRAEYADRLSNAEAKRIDAIRLVDVNAVAVASQRASDQATVLANQVAQSAEALRSLVASTANTVAQSQQTLANTLSTRITTLEQAGYQAQGKQTFQDPAFVELLREVKTLRESRATGTGSGEGMNKMWGYILGAAGAAWALAATFELLTNHHP
jgi:hypothetical protein